MRKKQGESIKLPEELQQYLRRYIGRYNDRGEKSPSRGELLLKAWKVFIGEVPAEASAEAQRSPVAAMPSPFEGLSGDQISDIIDLIAILREERQGSIFRVLALVIRLAVQEHRISRPQPEGASRAHPERKTGA